MSGLAQLLLSSGVSKPHHQLSRSDPGDIDPLGAQQRRGLIAVSCIAAVSLLATFSLLCFLTYRFIFWKKYYQRPLGHNHYVVLVYNLALADAQQCLGFMISLRWLDKNAVNADNPYCFLQGVWLQIGDPMSGLFVLVIAVYTALRVMRDYHISHRLFVTVVVSLWVFGILLFIIPIAVLGRWAWLPAVAWVYFHTSTTPAYITNLAYSAGLPPGSWRYGYGHTTSGSSSPSLSLSCSTPHCLSRCDAGSPSAQT